MVCYSHSLDHSSFDSRPSPTVSRRSSAAVWRKRRRRRRPCQTAGKSAGLTSPRKPVEIQKRGEEFHWRSNSAMFPLVIAFGLGILGEN
jgi:hypothetical protein